METFMQLLHLRTVKYNCGKMQDNITFSS